MKSSVLGNDDIRDIKLWFGFGNLLGYPTDHRSYLRHALKPHMRAEFLAVPRLKRKAILRFIIDEYERRSLAQSLDAART